MRQAKVTFLASLGSALEYYDFVVYGMMAKYLSKIFFPHTDSLTSLIQTFVIFALGYFARPVGGMINGMIADRYGRKNIFLTVMLSMALATFGIGLLPPYEKIGVLSAIFLVIFRLVQGFSFGAELPGAITLVAESSEKKRSFYSSFVISSTSIGSILATLVLYVLTQFLTEAEILAWGWRLPFWGGGILALISYMMRKELPETPAFLANHAQNNYRKFIDPLLKLLRENRNQMAIAFGLALFVSSLVILNLYFPFYLNKYFAFSSAQIYFAMTISLIWSALILPCFGYLADRFGEKRVLSTAITSFILLVFPLFRILLLPHLFALILFMIFYQTFLAAAISSYFSLIARLLPTAVRYTGIATCYNITYSITACVPAALTYFLALTGQPSLLVWYLIFAAGAGLLSLSLLSRETKAARS